MKRILLKFAMVMAVFGAAILISCETEPIVPACESGNYGDVTVKNSTGRNIWVDVTWGSYDTNYEKLLYNGSTYKYNEVHAGYITLWASLDGNEWYYNGENLSSCESMTYTWYLTGKKSTGCPFVLDIGNGVLVEPTLKVKE